MNLSNEDVRDILRLLDSTAYDELDLQTDRFRLSLRRAAGGRWTQEVQALTAPDVIAPAAAAAGVTAAASASAPAATSVAGSAAAVSGAAASAATAASHAGLHEVRPPMLGTFYRAPKPGAPPFVEVGSRVRADTVVCIVETMKLMNSVHAGVAGEVVEICLADAQFADEGCVLLRIRPEDE